MDTQLTSRQHAALDRIAEADPLAVVIGWIQYRHTFMPVVDAPGMTAIFAVEGRGAMRPPARYFLSPHAVESNLTLVSDRTGTLGVARTVDA